MISDEFNVFLSFILIGIFISFFFDFFRILRCSFKTPDFVTIIEDIAFWMISGIILLSGIFVLNEGKIRAYLFIGMFLGIVFYIITISKFVMKSGTVFFDFIKKIVFNPIISFFKIIFKILLKFVKRMKTMLDKIKIKPILTKKVKK